MKKMILKNIMIFDKEKGKGVDIDYYERKDGSRVIIAIDKLKEEDIHV